MILLPPLPTATRPTGPTLECQRCGLVQRYTTRVTSHWRDQWMTQRCSRCGTTHSCRYGRPAEAVSQPTVPVGSGDEWSPWHDGRYVPTVAGEYEVCPGGTARWPDEWPASLQKWRGKWKT